LVLVNIPLIGITHNVIIITTVVFTGRIPKKNVQGHCYLKAELFRKLQVMTIKTQFKPKKILIKPSKIKIF